MASAHPVPLAWLGPGLPFLLALAGVTGLALAGRVFAIRRFGKDRFIRAGRAVEQATLLFLFLGILFASILQIFLRNALHTGVAWTEPMARYLVLWIAFFGALTATSRARHLAIDVVALVLPPRRRAVLQRVTSVVAALVCGALANGAYVYLRQEYQFGKEAFLGLRTWAVQSVLLFGFGLLAYRFLVGALFGHDHDEGESAGIGERVR
jgi:TRAP-type C4-dicarboxylate transport system permease small subunit